MPYKSEDELQRYFRNFTQQSLILDRSDEEKKASAELIQAQTDNQRLDNAKIKWVIQRKAFILGVTVGIVLMIIVGVTLRIRSVL